MDGEWRMWHTAPCGARDLTLLTVYFEFQA
jgi:hypothetical protein